ncbi:MAG: type IV pilus biogenesis protein PilP [Gammaproteobacteria bacterium]
MPFTWGVVLGCLPVAQAGSAAVHLRPGFAQAVTRPGGLHPIRPVRFLASRLGQLRSEEVVLAAQLTIAKLRAEIARTRKLACDGVRVLPASGIGRGSRLARELVILPEIRSIEGMGGGARAVVQYPDGSRETVTVGSHLEDGLRVMRVGASGVTVDGIRGMRALPFAASSGGVSGFPIRSPIPSPPPAVLPGVRVSTTLHAGGRNG